MLILNSDKVKNKIDLLTGKWGIFMDNVYVRIIFLILLLGVVALYQQKITDKLVNTLGKWGKTLCQMYIKLYLWWEFLLLYS
jgi:hypothetical protein